MRKSRLSSLSSTGDTIIEVLLAIAFVSAVMGAAFVSANRSLNGTRVSQERGEALKLAQAQADMLNAAAKDPSKTAAIFNAPLMMTFHFNEGSPDPLQPVSGSRLQGPAGDTSRYTVRIERNPTNPNEFRSLVTWRTIGSGTQEESFIRYRVYAP